MQAYRIRLIAQGQVQGVGFRPFVFTLAKEAGLTGLVRNSPQGVVIEAQGTLTALDNFVHSLRHRLPPLARLTGLFRENLEPAQEEQSFVIADSIEGMSHAVLISPDSSICADCLTDMRNPLNRRFRYPFTNCTNCGPRYTITRAVPYDRACTSMSCFPLCPDCQDEYENPDNRRFHAQPNACGVCGPRVWFIEGGAEQSTALPELELCNASHAPVADDAAMRALAAFLAQGGIAAVKGLGGFHLACDARNDRAVALLRQRKNRPHKPFAVMTATLDDARSFAFISPEAERLLVSPEHPIVLCPMRDVEQRLLSQGISPDTSVVGVMLPYTPLHAVLFEHYSRLRQTAVPGAPAGPAVLVMTSGNAGGEPICLGNREALTKLGALADAFLFHNRDILIRMDDSVVRPLPGGSTIFYRRARGYVPRPVRLDPEDGELPAESRLPCVLGVGAELKNTLCLTKGSDAFVCQHIGDMANIETAAFHEEIRLHLGKLLKVQPEFVVRDLHPDYLASRIAEELAQATRIPVHSLQHHIAHAHAVLAEHGFRGKALALVLDGTGLGEDGMFWGGEFLFIDTSVSPPAHRRLAHLAPLDLPGGEAAIREPWRIAHALLLRMGLQTDVSLPWLPEYAATAALLPAMLERGINTPQSTSCGRLFDAVSALLGLCNAVSYEGQAAIRLEEAQKINFYSRAEYCGQSGMYTCSFAPASNGCLQLDTHALFAAALRDLIRHTPVFLVARRFHQGLASGIAALTAHLAVTELAGQRVRHVGLSGGCLQNAGLTLALAKRLRACGLTPLLHRNMPPGDGCISLGQAAWGRLMAEAAR